MGLALNPDELNSWLTKGLAPLIGLGMAVFLTVSNLWGAWAVPIIIGLVFGPGVAGFWSRSSGDKSDDPES